jgi:hypothetical protein
LTWSQLAWIGGFNDMAGMRKTCTSEALYISTKTLMSLDVSHCQAAKMPIRDYVNIMGGGIFALSGILHSTG